MTDELTVKGLAVEYVTGGQTIRPLDDLDMTARPGLPVLLLGPSGCGKTTLLSCLAGILLPTEGTISFGGTEVSALSGKERTVYRRTTVGVVFQAFNLVPSLTALENVEAPLLAAGVPRAKAVARATELLEQVDLANRLRNRPGELSGGQQQRVAIARALVNEPPVLLADEPTAHLDHIQVAGVVELLGKLAEDRLMVVATHDERLHPLGKEVVDLGKHQERTP